ncbi:MAG TPA: hypothetical protein VF785_18275 [Gemmatimonadaceae bacterium]
MSAAAIVGIIVALIVIGVGAWYVGVQRRRTHDLQAQYGPEYSRTVSQIGDQRRAEHELVKRQERVDALDIRPLSAEQRGQFTQQWRSVQAMFVDDPRGAVTRADGLVEEVMKTRGYPVSDFDQRAADLSVHHGRVVQNYRAAREIAIRHRRGMATTEDLRQAMVYYRELFQDLLEDREHMAERPVDRAVERDVQRAADDRVTDRVPSDNQRPIRVDRDVRP